MEYKTCPKCEGQGYVEIPNGPDDFDLEPCDECGQSGRVEVMPF